LHGGSLTGGNWGVIERVRRWRVCFAEP
jgi:hypothetical protein